MNTITTIIVVDDFLFSLIKYT
ncbi:hypothetical protein OOU_Y34scaffold01097g1 [Pyricularia oryzae Y34]|uniref:Uncharacterized protein n=1 Tax=Pyricularia oryzae (strain Y34) TaxID=1143189 RepID=A0AA97NLW9_PYRO3|nr:hypothetical protein OOU_Y34scaffold01097g1 [Pyricularia oryzae Y34]